ncbi:hypothetical protein [Dorea formicigenerans]|uniref:hypothetical protein n=1 Tax=Dorea formicigenerans TaxID=39486 RepID=UPI00156FA648|nr:hypothetical protein [Dorea formicigenerans]NSK21072.1 hypothetical protein [Dorea formicigenerans]
MARKPLSMWEQERKKQFDEAVREYSVDALKNIWKIANNALDVRTRLQANIWLAEKSVGKDYKAFEENEERTAGNVTINLIPMGESYITDKKDEQEIWEAENNLLYEELEDDDWGSEVYLP